MKIKTYHAVGTVLKANVNMVDREKVDTHNTQIHERSHSWIDTGTSIKKMAVLNWSTLCTHFNADCW